MTYKKLCYIYPTEILKVKIVYKGFIISNNAVISILIFHYNYINIYLSVSISTSIYRVFDN